MSNKCFFCGRQTQNYTYIPHGIYAYDCGECRGLGEDPLKVLWRFIRKLFKKKAKAKGVKG